MLNSILGRGVALIALWGICASPCAGQEAGNGSGVSSLSPPPAVLQVTGSQNKITISANHADVLSALKLVFTQARRQFVPDGGLSGEVTLALTDQTFATVLSAIDRQAFLRFDIDSDGIFRFHRDDRSLQEAFVRMRAMNAFLRDQLQRMGYSPQYSLSGLPQSQLPDRQRSAQTPAASEGQPAGTSPQPSHAQSEETPGAKVEGGAATSQQDAADAKPGSGLQKPVADALTPYDRYLRSLGLVGVRAPSTQPMPVVEVLKLFSRQSGVPILVDPGIPSGLRFRFSGNIVRPLPEALNLLSAVGQLEWHEVNGQIFITTTPDFKIFYGASEVPGGSYPSAPAQAQPGRKAQPMPSGSGSTTGEKHNTRSVE